MRFVNPQFLLLLTLTIPLAALLWRQRAKAPALTVADASRYAQLPETIRSRAARYIPLLLLPLLILLIIAMARPQRVARETTVLTKAVDLIIALDLSTSMLAEDPTPRGVRKSRLATAKEVVTDFLQKRSGDRIGLVAFAARPYPAAPLTLDHIWLKSAVERLQVGSVEDGTALGDGLLAALNRLRDKPTGSRAVILITDGRNNSGTEPEQAAAAAAALGVRVHTVGIGGSIMAYFPTEDPLGGISYRQIEANLDEQTLRMIAATTGGSYFRADDRHGLEQVFREIDTLEKRTIEEKVYFSYRELSPFCILAAMLLLFTGLMLNLTLLRRMP